MKIRLERREALALAAMHNDPNPNLRRVAQEAARQLQVQKSDLLTTGECDAVIAALNLLVAGQDGPQQAAIIQAVNDEVGDGDGIDQLTAALPKLQALRDKQAARE